MAISNLYCRESARCHRCSQDTPLPGAEVHGVWSRTARHFTQQHALQDRRSTRHHVLQILGQRPWIPPAPRLHWQAVGRLAEKEHAAQDRLFRRETQAFWHQTHEVVTWASRPIETAGRSVRGVRWSQTRRFREDSQRSLPAQRSRAL